MIQLMFTGLMQVIASDSSAAQEMSPEYMLASKSHSAHASIALIW